MGAVEPRRQSLHPLGRGSGSPYRGGSRFFVWVPLLANNSVSITVDLERFRRQMRGAERDLEQILSKTLNRVIFDIRDAERVEIGQAFEFAGAQTRTFLSGPGAFFRHKRATPDSLETILRPRDKTKSIIEDHVAPTGITISGGKRLGTTQDLAAPVDAVERGARGKVKKSQTPSTLLKKQDKNSNFGKVFTKDYGNFWVIFIRTGRKGKKRRRGRRTIRAAPGTGTQDIKAAYVLFPRAHLPKRIDYVVTAVKAAALNMEPKFLSELRKHNFKGS